MSRYQDTEREDIVRSINSALELLETHTPGPLCQKYIDELRQPGLAFVGHGASRMARIAQAETDRELAEALTGLHGVAGFFQRMAEVFRFHDAADTGGKGREVFRAVEKWCPLRDICHVQDDMAKERDGWLLCRYVERVGAMNEETVRDNLHRSPAYAAIGKTKGMRTLFKLEKLAGAFALEGDSGVMKLFPTFDPPEYQRHVMTALRAAAGTETAVTAPAPAPSIRPLGPPTPQPCLAKP